MLVTLQFLPLIISVIHTGQLLTPGNWDSSGSRSQSFYQAQVTETIGSKNWRLWHRTESFRHHCTMPEWVIWGHLLQLVGHDLVSGLTPYTSYRILQNLLRVHLYSAQSVSGLISYQMNWESFTEHFPTLSCRCTLRSAVIDKLSFQGNLLAITELLNEFDKLLKSWNHCVWKPLSSIVSCDILYFFYML